MTLLMMTARCFFGAAAYPSAKPRRWAPPLVTRFDEYNKQYNFFTGIIALLLHIILAFIQPVILMLIGMSAAKRSKSDARQFQKSWTAYFGLVRRK